MQKVENNQEVRKLNTWFSEEKFIEKIPAVETARLLVIIFLGIFIVATTELLNGQYNIIKVSLNLLISAIFGYAFSQWCDAFKKGSKKHQEALRINDNIDNSLQKVRKEWIETIDSIKSLKKTLSEDFLDSTFYHMKKRFSDSLSKIEEDALELEKLGFNSSLFLNEKKIQFAQIGNDTTNLIKNITNDDNIHYQSVNNLTEDLKVMFQQSSNLVTDELNSTVIRKK